MTFLINWGNVLHILYHRKRLFSRKEGLFPLFLLGLQTNTEGLPAMAEQRLVGPVGHNYCAVPSTVGHAVDKSLDAACT